MTKLRHRVRWLMLVGGLLGMLIPLVGPVPIRADEADAIEIREYEGQRLGSVDDFRETSIGGAPQIDPGAYRLRIDGLVEQTASFTLAQLGALDRIEKVVTLHCIEGWSVTALWEGIPLARLFAEVRPTAEANTVILHAADGYTTALSLDTILERDLIIADRINGIVLPPANGFPFQLVAEDKWGYKWIRWLTRIELSNDLDYRGFWEQEGFSNTAELDAPMFED